MNLGMFTILNLCEQASSDGFIFFAENKPSQKLQGILGNSKTYILFLLYFDIYLPVIYLFQFLVVKYFFVIKDV